jgi:hypothetical protein
MKFYRATDVVRFYSGVICLTPSQIAGRKPRLEVGPEGRCVVKSEVQFKRGEVIGLEEIPKVYANILEPVEEKIPAPPPPAKPKKTWTKGED